MSLVTPAFANMDEPEEEVAEHHHHHANHIAVFAGATTGLGDSSSTAATVGADYERRLQFAGRMIGVGALVDSAFFSAATETLLAGFVSIHPYGGLMVLGGAGVAMTGFAKDGVFAVRGAAAYYVPAGPISIGPSLSLDHANGENALVYGVSAGAGF